MKKKLKVKNQYNNEKKQTFLVENYVPTYVEGTMIIKCENTCGHPQQF